MTDASSEAWSRPIQAVGVIGLGGMGAAICRRLNRVGRAAGLREVLAFDADAAALEGMREAGITPCASIADLLAKADLILLCLTRPDEVAKTARSHGGLIDGVQPGQILIDHGWSTPDLSRQLATAFASRGAAFLDAPVSRSADAVRAVDAGRLDLAIGGDVLAIEAARPVLDGFASVVRPIGASGAAQFIRQMSDLVAVQTVAALAEALITARAHGVEGTKVIDTLAKGQGDTASIARHSLAELLGDAQASEGAQVTIREAGERLKQAIALAASRDLSLDGAANTLKRLETAMAGGLGERGLYSLFDAAASEPSRPSRQRQRA